MLFLIALMYILLCIRLRVQLEASFVNGHGSAVLCVGVWGMVLRREYMLVQGKHPFMFRFVPCDKKRRKEKKRVSGSVSRFMRDYVLKLLRNGRFDQLAVYLHLGLGDACETAVAAGAFRALLNALLGATGNLSACKLRIVPEFSRVCLYAQLVGVFSCQAGNVMHEALKAVLGRNKKEINTSCLL